MEDRRWTKQHSETILATQWLQVYREAFRLPDGNVIDDYYTIHRSDFVLIVAAVGRSIVLVRQYRPATERFYLSLPAGYIEQNERLEEAAVRELKEETGYDAVNPRIISELHPLPGYICSRAFVVMCDAVQSNAEIDRREIDGVLIIPRDRCLEMVRTGEINEMQAVSAILLAELSRQR